MDVLKVKFTHSNTVRDKKPYTIYEIEVRSSSTITWVIYKRYSGFYALHQELLKSNTLTPEQKTALPMLPPKRLTRSLAAEFVEKRKNELQEYLRAILISPGMVHCPIVLTFLEVPDSVRPMLMKGSNNGNAARADENSLNSSSANRGEAANLAHKTYEERKVLELLNLLKYNSNKVAAVKSFEDYFFEQRPRLSNDYIRLLLQGKNGNDGDGGLVQTCGDVNYSHVASRAALYLLCRLLDVEKNKDAQLFLDQFCSLDVSVLRRMQLHQHIISERGNRLGAFRIISILKHNVVGKSGDYIDSIVNDQWALREFIKWQERKNDQVVPYSTDTPDTLLKSLSLEVGFKHICLSTFAEVLKVANEDIGPQSQSQSPTQSGWRMVTPFNIQKQNESGSNSINTISLSVNGGNISTNTLSNSLTDSVTISYRKDIVRDVVLVRVQTIIPYSVSQISTVLTDLRYRRSFDIKFHRGKQLQLLDNDVDVVHLVFKSFSSPYKYRDFCVLRASTALDDGGRLLVARSVLHSQAPESKENVRAVLFPTGYILTPLTDQLVNVHTTTNPNNNLNANKQNQPSNALFPSRGAINNMIQTTNPASTNSSLPPLPSVSSSNECTLVTFIGQLDRESVLIVSPDLLGETNEFRESFHNLNNVLASLYGVRTLRPSSLTQNFQTFQKNFGNLLNNSHLHSSADPTDKPNISSPKTSSTKLNANTNNTPIKPGVETKLR